MPEEEIPRPDYLVSDLTVRDAEAFETYRTRAAKAIARYGGRYLVRGGDIQMFEEQWKPRSLVIVEFPSMEQARSWYSSPEYAAALEVHDIALERNLILADRYRDA